MNFNTYLTGYFIPLLVTLFTFRKEPTKNFRIIALIAICPIVNVIGFVFSVMVLAQLMHKKGYLPLSDD